MKYKTSYSIKLFFFWSILFLVVFLPARTFAGINIIAPDEVAKGDAFQVKIQSDKNVKNITYIWNGKKIKVVPSNEVTDTQNGTEISKILLPVPLDDKSTKRDLKIEARDASNALIASANKTIKIHEKKRPVQKLTVEKKYVSPPADQLARIKNDREKVNRALSQKLDGNYWDIPMERPVPGGISSVFGLKRVFNGQPRGVHKGLDLRGAEGTPIKACADGKVALVDNLYYSGNTVYVNHGNGVFSAYLHMSKPLVKPGEHVTRGQIIGLVGSTGRVTGPHLHLSIFAQGQSVDPLPLLANQFTPNDPAANQSIPNKTAATPTSTNQSSTGK